VTQPDPAAFAGFAEFLADTTGAVARRYFRASYRIEHKADSSSVIRADREAERAMREAIAARYPAHGIVGEEEGAVRAGAEYVWVLDPIDGTAQFVAGLPLFGTLIALCH